MISVPLTSQKLEHFEFWHFFNSVYFQAYVVNQNFSRSHNFGSNDDTEHCHTILKMADQVLFSNQEHIFIAVVFHPIYCI